MIDETDYWKIRLQLSDNNSSQLERLERTYTDFLAQIVLLAAPGIQEDFSKAFELRQFWINYAPKQRGRLPTGTAIPCGDLGEKTIITRLIRSLIQQNNPISHPGLPVGGDLRFATDNVLVHLDVKLTGPNDNPNEVVASSYQISGNGSSWKGGVLNAPFPVQGKRSSMIFQPQLSPFYVLDGKVLVCLTFYRDC